MEGIGIALVSTALAAAALFSAFSRRRFPGRGHRPSEKMLATAAAIAAVASLAWIGMSGMLRPVSPAAAAAAVSPTPTVSCATIAPGMSEDDVTRRMGRPDEKRTDEETRGPGAAILVYRQARCAVYLYGGRVESVD